MKNKFLIFASLILCIASVFSFALIPKSSASAEEITFNVGDVVSIPNYSVTTITINGGNYSGFYVDTTNFFSVGLFDTADIILLGITVNDTYCDFTDTYSFKPIMNFNATTDSIGNFECKFLINNSNHFFFKLTYGTSLSFSNYSGSSIVGNKLKDASVNFIDYFSISSVKVSFKDVEYIVPVLSTVNMSSMTSFQNSIFSVEKIIQYFNVSFNDYQGNNINSQSVQENSICIVPNAPVREGYDFIGWTSSVDGVGITSPITQDVTFTATYKLKSYDIIIKDWDGSVLQTISVNHGDTYTTDYIPSRTGYTFTGYTSDTGYVLGEVVTSDIVLTATYTINQYNVVFLGNGNTTIKSITCDYGTYLNVPTPPTIVGYTFSHWESSVDGVTPTSAVTQDVTFTAKYTLNVYVVNFIDENGVIEKTLNINHGGIVSTDDIPTTDKPGYKFLGWKSSVDTLSVNSQILSDVTFTKQYEIIQEFWDGVEYAGNTNYDNGYNDGQASVDTDTIYDNGYDKGYSDGYDVGLGQDNTYLLSDLFFGILDAPFNVIANAFDFEIFGIDIGNFFIVLISFLLIGWVIKRFL